MKDEYSSRDLRFEEAKLLYSKELTGPSLKYLSDVQRIKVSKIKVRQINEEEANHVDLFK